uniref:Uncharacterized protein n=1 Tax=Anguilla anguilla TaxID=7936 RepID=A0A0E9T7W2_ANGAN
MHCGYLSSTDQFPQFTVSLCTNNE